MTTTPRTALITGASAGIGKAFSHKLAAEGYNLVLVARRKDRLRSLAQTLSQEYGIRAESIAVDLSDPSAPDALLSQLKAGRLNIDFLINNAGFSGKGYFAQTPWEDLSQEIQVMMTAVTQLAHGLAPGMIERGWGRIINLSSIAAYAPPGRSLLYTAIKSYVLLMSESLDMELKPHGVHVTALCPGFTYSEFHDVMGTREQASNLPELLWMNPEEVVNAGYKAVMRGQPICVPGTVNKLLASSSRILPERLRYFLGRRVNPFK